MCVKRLAGMLVCSLFAGYCAPVHAQIFINEVHVQPLPDSAGVPGEYMANCVSPAYGAEWVEIYNSSLCDTFNLECYMLASKTSDSNYTTFAFPANTFLPPLGFFIIGGTNAPSVDFSISQYCVMSNRCGWPEWHLDNSYGWVALYNAAGAVQDAVFWTPSSGQSGLLTSHPAYSGQPCAPSSCTPDTLKPAEQMTLGNEIRYAGKAPAAGLTIYRQTDGTGGWRTDGTPTPRACNGICATPSDLSLQISLYADETCLQANGWALAEYYGGVAPYDIDWSNQSNADSISGLSAGCYSVSVTDSLGCFRMDSICLINTGTPVVASITPDQSTIFKGESIQLSLVTPAVVDSIVWTPGESLSCADCRSPTANPLTVTTYTASVVDTDGCAGSANATVEVLSDENSAFIPTAFTPNDDNLNDLLFVRSPKVTALEFRIFDRWGTEVFATNNINTGWDGRDKGGNEVDVGIYVYYAIVTFDNGKSKTLKGNVGVIR